MKLFMPNIIHITQLDNLSPIVSVWEQFIYIFVKITKDKIRQFFFFFFVLKLL